MTSLNWFVEKHSLKRLIHLLICFLVQLVDSNITKGSKLGQLLNFLGESFLRSVLKWDIDKAPVELDLAFIVDPLPHLPLKKML